MMFTAKDQSAFENAKICWICQKEFSESKKVRDHCHFTGKFRGAAHNICNLQFKKPKFTPVIFHNLSGYDAHLFVKNLGKTEGNIKCIPNNEEKYISFSKDIVVDEYTNKKGEKIEIMHEIRFLDSFKFMASSLENLVRNLAKSDLEKLKETEKSFGDGVKLLSRKGIYPYDYMSKIEKFSETQLPPKEESQMMIIITQKKFGKNSESKISENIMIFISSLMFFFLQMFLRSFEMFAWKIIHWIQHGIILLQDYLGMRS